MLERCPCHSGKEYANCCKPYHEGQLPENALHLMRSRFAAYALGLTQYIMDTTHPHHPDKRKNSFQWMQEIAAFSRETDFENLIILDFKDGKSQAFVKFKAVLKQKGNDLSFVEESEFRKEHGRWFYLAGSME